MPAKQFCYIFIGFMLVACGTELLQRVQSVEKAAPFDSRLSILTTPMGASNDTLYSKPVLLTDGRYVAAGATTTQLNTFPVIASYTANGRLDTSFYTTGVRITTFGSSLGSQGNGLYYSLLLQTDAQLVGVGYVFTTSGNYDVALARYNTDGTLDTSYSTDGMATFGIASSTQFDQANAAVLNTDGTIVVAGRSGTLADWLLVRVTSSGTLDTGFNTYGYQTIDMGSNTSETAYSLLLLTDGRLFAIGQTKNGSDYDDTGAARFNADGTLDTSFHTDGRNVFSLDVGCDTAVSSGLQTDGRYVLGGQTGDMSGNSALISRLNTDGNLDTSFFTSGTKKDAPFASTRGFRIDIDTTGRLLVSGQDDTNYNAYVGRYSTDGTRDTSFNGVGYRTLDLGGPNDLFYGVVNTPSGDIVIAGTGGSTVKADFVIGRFLIDGSLDTSFFTAGYRTSSAGLAGKAEANALAMQSDGATLAAGYAYNGCATAWAISRFAPGWVLDTSFATTGKAWGTSTNGEPLTSIVIQTDGKILGAGESASDIFYIRLLTNGHLDTSFHTDGSNYIDYQAESDTAGRVILQTDGKGLLAVSVKNSKTPRLLRATTDGRLDTSYNTTGFSVNLALGTDGYSRDLYLLDNGSALVAGTSTSLFLVARVLSNGTLDTAFSTDGSAKVDVAAAGSDDAKTLTLGPDGKIVLAGSSQVGSYLNHSVARVTSDGALDTSFYTDGGLTFAFGTFGEYTERAVVQRNSKIIMGGRASSSTGTTYTDMVVTRLMPDGTLDTSFNTSGKIIHSLGMEDDYIHDIILLTDGRYMAAGAGVENDTMVFALVKYFP